MEILHQQGKEAANMPTVYEIRVEGCLEPCWAEYLHGMTVTPLECGETLITGSLPDQSALYGLLKLLRDMNLCLVSVNRNKDQQ